MAFADVFPPVATSTVALIMPPQNRASGVVFVYLGFSLAVAAGLPTVAFMSAHLGWHTTFAAVGVAALLCAALLLYVLPKGLRGAPLSLESWSQLLRNRLVLLLLVLSTVQVSGQFTIFTYLGPLLARLANANVATISAFFSLFGVMGIIGNIITTRLVVIIKPFLMSGIGLLSMLIGFTLWSAGAGMLSIMGAGIVFWGLGFAAINSMQQARLVTAVPTFASAAVALNTSAIFIGQAIGSALGGHLFAQDMPQALGYSAVMFTIAALGILMTTRAANS